MFSQEAVDNMREASLQMGFKAGITAEQERIIKLLESQINDELQWVQLVMDCATPYEWVPMLIALIKGECDPDACEPDLPCINGFSCSKHKIPADKLIALIKGENK